MTRWCLIPNLLFYFLSTLFYLLLPFGASIPLEERKRFWLIDAAYVFALFGAFLELIYLSYGIYLQSFSPFVLLSFGLAILFLWFGRERRWQALGAIFVPLAFIFLLLSLGSATQSYLLEKLTGLMVFHVVLALLALVFLLGNFCLGVAFLIHERNLKIKRFDMFTMNLPPLLFSEKQARLFLQIGFVLLSLVLISGSLLGFQEWMHVLLALVAWGLYAALLNRRWSGAQGKKMVLLSLLGFVSLAFAYLWT